jgi:universal stress protein E
MSARARVSKNARDMKTIRKVLVAVKNPDARRHPGVDKAIGIAKLLGASVELFNAISTPVFLELEPLTGRSLAEIKRQSLALRTERLEKLVKLARRRGVEASCHVGWDFPPHEAIVRRAAAIHADLVIAECHAGKRLKPWLLHLTDWELLRLSPRPVLLLKNDSAWRQPVILGAVDPSHARDKPARLDAAIVEYGKLLSRTLRGSLELVHANFPSAFGLLASDPATSLAAIAEVYDAQKRAGKQRFEAFAAKAGFPKARCHLVDSEPVFGIPHIARKIGADLVVMGAVSRSGLKRVFIGNTAEQVLEALPCDVLVVKPVSSTPRVARKSRGMRIVPSQPLMPLPV